MIVPFGDRLLTGEDLPLPFLMEQRSKLYWLMNIMWGALPSNHILICLFANQPVETIFRLTIPLDIIFFPPACLAF